VRRTTGRAKTEKVAEPVLAENALESVGVKATVALLEPTGRLGDTLGLMSAKLQVEESPTVAPAETEHCPRLLPPMVTVTVPEGAVDPLAAVTVTTYLGASW